MDAYASVRNLGTSVVDYLDIPVFDAADGDMLETACMAKRLSRGEAPEDADEARLDLLVKRLLECRGRRTVHPIG